MKILIIITAFLCTYSNLNASLSSSEVERHKNRILKVGAEIVFKELEGPAYLFTISSHKKTIDVIIMPMNGQSGEQNADVFLSERNNATTPRVAWTLLDTNGLSRFYYVLEYSDILALGERVYEDPHKILVLTEETIFKVQAKRDNRIEIIEREMGDSLPMDHVFGFVNTSVVRRLETREH
jgi:hypothetical protein